MYNANIQIIITATLECGLCGRTHTIEIEDEMGNPNYLRPGHTIEAELSKTGGWATDLDGEEKYFCADTGAESCLDKVEQRWRQREQEEEYQAAQREAYDRLMAGLPR